MFTVGILDIARAELNRWMSLDRALGTTLGRLLAVSTDFEGLMTVSGGKSKVLFPEDRSGLLYLIV